MPETLFSRTAYQYCKYITLESFLFICTNCYLDIFIFEWPFYTGFIVLILQTLKYIIYIFTNYPVETTNWSHSAYENSPS